MIYTNLHRLPHKKAKVHPSIVRPATTSAPRPTASQNTVISTLKKAFHTSPTHSQTSDDDAEELESVPMASAYDHSSIIVCSHNDSLNFFSSRVRSHSSGMQALNVSQMAISSTCTVRSCNVGSQFQSSGLEGETDSRVHKFGYGSCVTVFYYQTYIPKQLPSFASAQLGGLRFLCLGA